MEKRHADLVRTLIGQGLLSAVHDLSDGGLIAAAAEMAMASGVGMRLENRSTVPDHAYYFGEDQARFLVGVSPDSREAVILACQGANAPVTELGEASGDALVISGPNAELCSVALTMLRTAHEAWMPSFMGATA